MKADIIRTGVITKQGQPMGFLFDCKSMVPMLGRKPDGTMLYGGYTVEELKELVVVH